MTDKWRIILVPHTHWDREWYFPYQRFRTRLVGFFDLLLDILDTDPEYRHFMLDGHTILIEDYLEVRPERRALIERYVLDGRLSAGPWYVIPDEFLPSGEALIRNLLRGHRGARELGGVMQVGYLPDPFGQIAHLPAILRGFGIERCVFWRGTDDSVKTAEFRWASPDGSEVTVRNIRGGYGIGGPFPTEDEAFLGVIDTARARLQPLATGRTLLLMWGSDHVAPQRGLTRAIRNANARLADAEIVHGNLPLSFDELEAISDRALPKHDGEFRSGQHANVLPGVLSARMWIKQRTFQCEQLLTRWAEPLTLWSGLLRARLGETWNEPPWPAGPPSPQPDQPQSEAGLLDRAWRLLLENQPHDSICGCSVDQTHNEMRPRFDQCDQIGEDLTYQAMRRIGAQGPAERVYVFNALPHRHTGYVTAVVPSRDDQVPLALIDERGSETPVTLIEDERLPAGRQTIGFVARDVPGCGYTTYGIRYGAAPSRRRGAATRIENEFLRVEASPRDGTLTVTDKRSRVTYRGLNRIVDGGDRGDEYNYCAPEEDLRIDAPAATPVISVAESPASCTLDIRMTYRLPARLLANRRRRARATVSCPVRMVVRLVPGVPRVDVRAEIENNAEDHRLRVYFPTGIQSDISYAEQHFGVIERPIALPEDTKAWQEQPVPYHPQKTFVDVNDGGRGLTIANRGLPEYEVMKERGACTIALTLQRCVGWLSRDDLSCRKGHAGPPLETPGAQEIGSHVFEYSIISHEGGWQNAYLEAHRFATPLRARWNPAGTGALPPTASFFQADGDSTVVTALKRAEDGDGTIVRLYNIADRRSKATLRLSESWSRTDIVTMAEDQIEPAPAGNGRVRLDLRPNQIITLRLH
jgi:alpha-mannosidase